MKNKARTVIRKIRHHLGLLKFKILDDLAFRSRMKTAQSIRENFKEKIYNLPPISNDDENAEVEVHMLCGKAQMDMGIAASWSLMRYLPNSILYVHSDGTLDEKDILTWKKVIKSIVLIPKDMADKKVKETFSETCPLLYKWRMNNWAAYQTIDYCLFGHTNKIISCDSDVLCLKEPKYLKEKIYGNDAGIHWNEDIRSCYSASVERLKQVTQLDIAERFNLGFIMGPRLAMKDFLFCENLLTLLNKEDDIDLNHLWASQTYYAFFVSRYPFSKPLPREYSVAKGRTKKNTVIRHYVGIPSIRHRYFTEGLKIVFNKNI